MGHDIRVEGVASLSRSAFNPLNQVIYLALGVMDEAYAEVSGCGTAIDITLEQFRNAREMLENKSFEDIKLDPHHGHGILDAFKQMGMQVATPFPTNADVTPEKQFLDCCIEHLERTGQDSLSVFFG